MAIAFAPAPERLIPETEPPAADALAEFEADSIALTTIAPDVVATSDEETYAPT